MDRHPHLDPVEIYRQAQTRALTPRAAEAQALMKAARLLEGARRQVGTEAGAGYAAYADALRFNQTLWTLLQADLMARPRRLPGTLTAELLSLSLFVDRETAKALADPRPRHLDALIAVDRNLALGLSASPSGPRSLP